MKASVVIPTYQGCKSLKRLLNALCNQTFPPDDFELVVSIDGSDDGTKEMLENYKAPFNIRYIWDKNSGRAAACNKGIRLAQGKVLIILDDDMEPSSGMVEAHYSAHLPDSNLGVIGAAPIALDDSSTPITRFVANRYNPYQSDLISDQNRKKKLSDFYGGNFSIIRENLLKVGLFNEDFTIYGYEDTELAYRLIKSGLKIVYSADALCIQHYEVDLRSFVKKTIDSGKMAVQLINIRPDTFDEIKISTYKRPRWKWRSLRYLLVRLSYAVPITTDLILMILNIVGKTNFRFQDRIYHKAQDYFFWLGVWSELKSQNNKELMDKIFSYS